jgi:hypothetical protein
LDVREALATNRSAAVEYSTQAGAKNLRALLAKAEKDLQERIAGLAPGTDQTFTAERMRAVLAQVQLVIRQMQPGFRNTVVDAGKHASDMAVQNTIDYLMAADAKYRGVGAQPLALDDARMFDAGAQGARASILRRLVSAGEDAPGATGAGAKPGILQRYGMNVIEHFENVLQQHVVQRTSWADATSALKEKSPFLQGAPAHWAERILRTELMGGYARSAYEATRAADEDLGDVVKILVATFDDRTASDSYAVHGQIRRPAEAFDTWQGAMQHPPARPNDREVVVTHRIAWPIPKELMPRSRSEVVDRWQKEGRKGSPPATPIDSTVDRALFGATPPAQTTSDETTRSDLAARDAASKAAMLEAVGG